MGFFQHLWWWIEVHTGTVNESGPYYGFFSGFGSDIGEVTLVTGMIVGLRHINCHVTGCKAIRTHIVPNTPYRACRKHHPTVPTDGKITPQHISDAHEAQL